MTLLTPDNLLIALLLILAYGLVTAVLNTLSARVRTQRSKHDLIRMARERRAQYYHAIAERQAGFYTGDDDAYNVEIIDD